MVIKVRLRAPRDARLCLFWGVFLCFMPLVVNAQSLRLAVASNFKPVMVEVVRRFEAQSQFKVVAVYGASGKLYSQIVNGAPFDLFFSADKQKPRALVDAGKAYKESQFTYANGALALWCLSCAKQSPLEVLKSGKPLTLAIANPKFAPYGVAAIEVVDNLDMDHQLFRRATGENISQAFQFVQTGNAKLGFVALSQVLSVKGVSPKDFWVIPNTLYNPIEQVSVIIKHKKGKHPGAEPFFRFIQSPEIQALILSRGYSPISKEMRNQ